MDSVAQATMLRPATAALWRTIDRPSFLGELPRSSSRSGHPRLFQTGTQL